MFQGTFLENKEQISSKKRIRLKRFEQDGLHIGMFDQQLEREEFCRNDYNQSLERN